MLQLVASVWLAAGAALPADAQIEISTGGLTFDMPRCAVEALTP